MGGIRAAVESGDVVEGVAFAEQMQDVFHAIQIDFEDFDAALLDQP